MEKLPLCSHDFVAGRIAKTCRSWALDFPTQTMAILMRKMVIKQYNLWEFNRALEHHHVQKR